MKKGCIHRHRPGYPSTRGFILVYGPLVLGHNASLQYVQFCFTYRRLNFIEQISGSDGGNLLQFVKYGISGCIATATHILVFHLVAWKLFFALQADDWFVKLLHLPIQKLDDKTRSRNSMKGNGVAFVISNLVAYLINIYWVFVPGRYPWIMEIGLFYLVSGVAIVIGTGLMGLLIRRFGMLTTYAFGANVFAALMINYIVRKFFIFKS